MAGKLSGKAQQMLAVFDEARVKMDRIHALVEQCAAAKVNPEQFMAPITNAATDVSRVFMNAGYGVIADSANQIAMGAKRGGGVKAKVRAFRELVSSIKAAMETQTKIIVAEEAHKNEGGA